MSRMPPLDSLRRLGTADVADATARFLAGVRRGGHPTIGCSIRHARSSNRGTPYLSVSALSVRSVVNLIFAVRSRLLFLAEFLESRIGAQRVPDWIDP